MITTHTTRYNTPPIAWEPGILHTSLCTMNHNNRGRFQIIKCERIMDISKRQDELRDYGKIRIMKLV